MVELEVGRSGFLRPRLMHQLFLCVCVRVCMRALVRVFFFFSLSFHHSVCSKARRLPSWCDRIQWRIQPPGFEADGTPILYPHDVRPSLQLLLYNCHPQYTNSDHKPVSGCWLMAVSTTAPCAFYVSSSLFVCFIHSFIYLFMFIFSSKCLSFA